MINKSHHVFSGASCLLGIITILAFGCGRSGGSPGGVETKNMTMPKIDPHAPFPALNADAFDALSAAVPELVRHREEVLAAEREAIKGVLGDMRAKSHTAAMTVGDPTNNVRMLTSALGPRPDAKTVTAWGFANDNWVHSLISGRFNLIPVAMAAESDLSSLGFAQQFLIGHQVGFLMVADLGKVNQSDVGSKSVTLKDAQSGKVIANMTLSVDTAGGPPTSELATTVTMPVFGLDAHSKVSLTGELCPNAEGKVDFTMRLSSVGRAGRAGSVFYDQNIEARVTATVGDDANIVTSDFDVRQTTRSAAGDVQTSQVVHGQGSSGKDGDAKVIGGPSTLTGADSAVSSAGLGRAYNLGRGALESAREHWQGGRCVKIEATSPGAVQPNSSHPIPVTVRHRLDGSEVPSKLDALLTGEKSVDPTSLAKTAGTLTYTAPAEHGKDATIALTATSRRGKATLELSANTGGASYQIVGGRAYWQTDTPVCDIMKPFTLTGGGLTHHFTGGLSGTFTYTGPFNAQGGGSYTISLPGGLGKQGHMTGGTAGSVLGKYSGTDTSEYILQPIPPCK